MLSPKSFSLLFLHALIIPVADTGYVHVDNKPQVRVTASFVNFYAHIINLWGDGEGRAPLIISNVLFHPFTGRQFGGAKRGEIRGTNAFGSGYPYS
ncbi:hypothetical protein PIIN_09181 [Serendipita indica DSM 11827]|uniref:Dirigent protein n=1 Tax=Serendipita indica (strain DSM 11827) TaxID=1109443 RepID=G4TV54_SERID|nr:hypothetical protein PIIN_09181 [Serendipita indica DSM 11827]